MVVDSPRLAEAGPVSSCSSLNTAGVTLNLSNLSIRDFGRPAVYVTNGLVNINNSTFIGHQRSALSIVGSNAKMNIASSTFLSNTSNGSGGAIYNTGAANHYKHAVSVQLHCKQLSTVARSTTQPVAQLSASTVQRFVTTRRGYGGAIENSAVMSITNSAILNNTALNAGGSGGGGLFQGNFGNLNLVNVTFSGNSIPSTDRGAAIFIGGTAIVASASAKRHHCRQLVGDTGEWRLGLGQCKHDTYHDQHNRP